MTTTDHTKVIKQLKGKPGKMAKYSKYSVPKTRTGSALNKKCKRCGRTGGHISKYGLNLCRQCFRDIASRIGFKKYN
jgi:small subunit ribosomal protein S14